MNVRAYQKKNDGKKGKGLTGEEKGELWNAYNKKIKENTNWIATGRRGENLPEEKQAGVKKKSTMRNTYEKVIMKLKTLYTDLKI